MRWNARLKKGRIGKETVKDKKGFPFGGTVGERGLSILPLFENAFIFASNFLKKVSKSTQKYTRPVLFCNIEKEPEQELTCFGFFVPCNTRKGLSMSMLEGNIYERTNSILEYYLPIRLKEQGLDCKVDCKRNGPRNLKVSLSIPGSEEVRTFNTEPEIRKMNLDRDALKAEKNLITYFSAQVRLMEMELTDCHGIHRKKNGSFHIPSKYALLDSFYISLLPKEAMDSLSEIPHKRLVDGTDFIVAIGFNFFDEVENVRRFSYVPQEYLDYFNIPLEEAWKTAEKNTISITKPEVSPFAQKSLDGSVDDGDIYFLEAREDPYVAAGSIALPGFLKKVSENLHHNLWILPVNNMDVQFFMEGSTNPCSMDTVDRLTDQMRKVCAVSSIHRVLPDQGILHYDREMDTLETGREYVQGHSI